MFDHSRLVRLITLALASCAVTWALAGAALAVPDVARGPQPQSDDNAPAFKAVPGDANKAPSAEPPAFKGINVDANKAPNPAQVDKVLAGINNKSTEPVANAGNYDTGTIALIIAIAAILTALGAVTLTVTRTHRPMLGG
jgi:hypothetical protein